MEFSAELIADFLQGEIQGDKNATVSTMAKIEEATSGAIAFLANPKYEQYIYTTAASIVIVNKTFEPTAPVAATLIKVEDAYSCFAKLLELYVANKPQKKGVSDKAAIDESASVGEDCFIGAFAVLDKGVKVGDNCKIYPHVYLGDNVVLGNNVTLNSGVKIYEGCVIGDNVTIHSGSIIGADGFGFAPNEKGEFSKIPQIGNVIIEHDVEIGANTCIDRATMGSTVVKSGAKLDNLIQLGHNVVIGHNTVCAAQCGIAGSVTVGDNCMFGGQVGISGHLQVGDRVQLASKTGISKTVPVGEVYMGYPGIPASKFHRANVIYRNLPDMSAKLSKLEKQIKQLVEQDQK